MSALLNVGPRRPDPGPQRRPHLSPVPAPVRARLSRVPFLLVLAATLGLGMAGLLVLNTTVQTNAVEVRTLQQQLTSLSYTEAELKTQLDEARSPATLATRASDLGMRPNPYPAFIDLETGEVTGDPQEVEGDEMESLVTKSQSRLAAEQAAAQQRAEQQRAEQAAEQQAQRKKEQQAQTEREQEQEDADD
ncbi:hypothetical protein DT076_04085 [Desertihabitans brevis]|uniref:Cell division protein FtsL n=1 Tax=Desertihabitans brevis TaxID=2268447 RepID=A0A367YYL7_9ACTN|nr:hypothetical protein [Desertihabitans brevis]RCK70609.1 hypothetical protein DT076_04085 [Desertihabitans brevis]